MNLALDLILCTVALGAMVALALVGRWARRAWRRARAIERVSAWPVVQSRSGHTAFRPWGGDR